MNEKPENLPAYLNGVFGPLGEMKVSVMDRGFLFGDGVYEVIRVVEGRCIFLERHLRRLKHNLAYVGIQEPDGKEIREVMLTLIQKLAQSSASIYIQVTRGVDLIRNHLGEGENPATFFMMIKEFPPMNQKVSEPISISSTIDLRGSLSEIKSINLLANVLALRESHRLGLPEVLFVGKDGIIREGARQNILMLKNQELVAVLASPKSLPGVTQEVLLEVAEEIGMTCSRRDILLEELFEADAVFLSNTSTEIQRVKSIDGKDVFMKDVDLLEKLHLAYLSKLES